MWAPAETADEQRTTYNAIHLAYFTACRIHLGCNVQHVAQELFFLAAAENRDEQRKAALLEQCVRRGSPCTLSELRDCPIKLLGLDHGPGVNLDHKPGSHKEKQRQANAGSRSSATVCAFVCASATVCGAIARGGLVLFGTGQRLSYSALCTRWAFGTL
jgi:hypothetical protein